MEIINIPFIFGEMAEWSIATVLKTVVLRGTGGSNPSLSAKRFDWLRFSQPVKFLCRDVRGSEGFGGANPFLYNIT